MTENSQSVTVVLAGKIGGTEPSWTPDSKRAALPNQAPDLFIKHVYLYLSTLIFKLRTESVEALRAGMDQHMEVADVSDDDGGGGGRTPLYLSRRQLAALRRQRLEHWKISLWHSRCLLGAFSVGSSG